MAKPQLFCLTSQDKNFNAHIHTNFKPKFSRQNFDDIINFQKQNIHWIFQEEDSRYTLYAGTHVTEGRNNAMALVFGTGFSTSKGMLVRSILYPKPTKFKFYRDSFRFVGVLFFIAMIGQLLFILYLFFSMLFFTFFLFFTFYCFLVFFFDDFFVASCSVR